MTTVYQNMRSFVNGSAIFESHALGEAAEGEDTEGTDCTDLNH